MANVIINDTNLTNIANAIREKNGLTDTYKPSEMAAAIINLPSGGSDFEWPTELTITGYISNGGAFDWLWIQLPGEITINNGSGSGSCFLNSKLTDLSKMTIIMSGNSNHSSYFNGCDKLVTLPNLIITGGLMNCVSFFSGCQDLKTIPKDFFMGRNGSTFELTGALGFNDAIRTGSMFYGCYALRSLPTLDDGTQRTGYNGNSYTQMFTSCFALDEITDIPVYSKAFTSNQFTFTFDNCCRVKKITFATQAGGTPYSATWSNQTIKLDSAVGYGVSSLMSGWWHQYAEIALDAEVTQTTLSNIENYPNDWWTNDVTCSRYDHDSAVETINSLPDCSAGSGNVIKFTGASGSVYSKAISSLTEEEIAVATAKGWTVTLV